MLLNLIHDGGGGVCTLVKQHFCAMSWMGGSEVPTLLTTLCRDFQSETAGSQPNRDAAGQYVHYTASVESGEDGRGEMCSLYKSFGL